MIKKLISIISALLILSAALTTYSSASSGYSEKEIKAFIDSIISYKASSSGAKNTQELISGALTKEVGSSAEWYIISLSQYDSRLDFTSYKTAIEKHIKSGKKSNAVISQKNALALIASGYSGQLTSEVLENTTGKLGIMSYIFALHLINNGVNCNGVSSEEIIKLLLDNRKSDGGWALTGNYSDVDVTAMTTQALAAHYKDKTVKQAVDKAVSLLSSKITESAGFVSYGVENSESTSQVITALSCLGIDCTKDSRFIKNGKNLVDTLLNYRTGDGAYSHEVNGKSDYNSTVQALSAFVSLYRVKKGLGSYYMLDAVKHNSTVTTTAGTTAKTTTVPATTASATRSTTVQTTKPAVQTTAQRTTRQAETTTRASRSGGLLDFFTRNEASSTSGTTTTQALQTTQSQSASSAQSPVQTSTQTTVQTTAQSTAQAATVLSTSTTAATAAAQNTQLTQTTEHSTSEETATSTEAVSVAATEYTADTTQQTTENTAEESKNSIGIKPYIAAAIIVLAACIILILHKREKGGKLTYCIICVIAAVMIFLTFTVNIQSKEEYYKADSTLTDGITVTLSIRCDTVAGRQPAPESGIILDKTELTVENGSTVYDVLIKAAKEYGIQVENSSQIPGDNSTAYISGINYLYEFSFGDLSGWMYKVNSVSASVGCGAYTLEDGDNIEFLYTCNLGEDLK